MYFAAEIWESFVWEDSREGETVPILPPQNRDLFHYSDIILRKRREHPCSDLSIALLSVSYPPDYFLIWPYNHLLRYDLLFSGTNWPGTYEAKSTRTSKSRLSDLRKAFFLVIDYTCAVEAEFQEILSLLANHTGCASLKRSSARPSRS